MSQETIAPAEAETTNPVGTQEVSEGKPKKHKYVEKEDLTGEHDKILEPEPEEETKDQENFKKAVAEAVKKQFDVTDGWKPKSEVKFVIYCPSGQPVLAKFLGARDLLRAGLLEEMDTFTKRLFPSSFDAQGNPQEEEEEEPQRGGIWAVLRDPEKRLNFFDLTNRLICVAAIKPKVINDGVVLRHNEETGQMEEVFGHEIEDPEEQMKLFGKLTPVLREGETYAGAIEIGDRTVFFQELNKPLGMIEPFRETEDAVLANMEPVKSAEPSAE